MRGIIILVIFFAIVGGGFSAFWFSTGQVTTREIRAQFEEFSEIVATQKREAVAAHFKKHIKDDAKIKLDISFSTIGVLTSSTPQRPMMSQEFNKTSFIQFIDNTLYSLNEYQSSPELVELNVNEDKTMASIQFKMRGSAAGSNMVMGTNTPTRWVVNGDCKGDVVLGDILQFSTLYCNNSLMKQPDLNKVNLQDMMQQIQKP